MNPFRSTHRWLRSFANRRAAKQEIDEELRFHLEQRTADDIAAGMLPEEAAREARKRFGNMQGIREGCREVSRVNWGETLIQDVRFGLRMVGKNPGFTSVVVLSLALGIGVNVMIFTVFNATFLRPVPAIEDPGGLVEVSKLDRSRSTMSFSYPEFEAYRDRNSVFSGLLAWIDRDARGETITLGNGPEDRNKGAGAANLEEIPALLVSDNYFTVLGVHLAAGRAFPSEGTRAPGSQPVVVLSHRLWQRRFGASPEAVGRTVALNGVTFTIIGIAPADFCGFGDLRATDAWVPLLMAAELDQRANWASLQRRQWFHAAGRLKPGVNLKEAEASTKVLHAQLAPSNVPPEERPRLRLQAAGTLAPLAESMDLVLPMMASVSLVLVIACANVANLLLTRAVRRRKEMGIRLAVGASRGRLIRQLMTESLLIALAGGALGLLMGCWSCSFAWRIIRQSLPDLQRYLVDLNIAPDWRTVAYVLPLTVLAAIVFGIAPAFATSCVNPNLALKEDGAWFDRRFSRPWLRHVFALAQVAACLSLLVGVSELWTASRRSGDVKLGYEPRNVVLARFDLPRLGYSPARALAFQNQALERLRNLPGVAHVSLARETLERSRHVDCVSPGYFKTMGMTILQGRDFVEQDAASAVPVAVVSEATAARLWPGQDPIGQRLTNGLYAEVIGVVGNVRNLREVLFRQTPYTPELPGGGREDYLFLAAGRNLASTPVALLVKSEGPPARLMPSIREELRRLDPDLWVSVTKLTQDMEDGIKFFGILEAVADLIGLSALLLAALGIYGVMAYSVNQRTREIGIRIALGAQRGDVLRPIMGNGLRLIVVGVALGLPAARALSGALSSALIDLHPLEPLTFLLAALWLGSVMMMACYIPARRATKIDPMTALRYE